MARTGNVYDLPGGASPIISGEILTSLQHNSILNDIATALTESSVLFPAEAAKTTNYTVVTADTVGMLTNRGAVSPVVFTLPAASTNIGSSFTFHKVNDQDVTITAVGTDVVMDSAAAGSISNTTATETFATLTLKAVPLTGSTYSWMITAGFGTWTTS